MTQSTQHPAGTRIIPWDRLHAPAPQGHLLGNGRYLTLVTAAGTGFSRCAGQALTRWDGDPVQDACGLFVYLQDLDRGECWSAGHQPVRKAPDEYQAAFTDGRAILTRRDHDIGTTLEVAVLPDSCAELRRLTLRNLSGGPRRIEVTTCLEAVLNEPEADAAHPAFSKLFVQTRWEARCRALLARRRPRSAQERPRWMYHWMAQGAPEPVSFDSDRARFLGRGRTLRRPQALLAPGPLSGTEGNVLDPVLALRTVLLLPPGGTRVVSFGLGYAEGEEEALGVCEGHQSEEAVQEAFRECERRARADREGLGLSLPDALRFTQLATDLLYRRPAPVEEEKRPAPGAGLLPDPGPLLGGDSPSPLLLADSAAGAGELRRAKAFWSLLGLQARVAWLGARPAADAQEGDAWIDEGRLDPPLRLALLRHASLRLEAPLPPAGGPSHPLREPRYRPLRGAGILPKGPQTILDNGWGGFSPDGREYVIRVGTLPDGHPHLPPMPWSNVIANERFGFITTERGVSTTWGPNSRLHRVTPWFNDPAGDPLAEAFYLRDEASLDYWSLTPGPVDGGIPCTVRHGFGTTSWESRTVDLDQELLTFAARKDPLKLTRIRLRNTGPATRRLTLLWHAQLALGDSPRAEAGRVDTRKEGNTLLAWNRQDGPLAGLVAFAAFAPEPAGLSSTTDRSAFLGPFGSPEAPQAVTGDGPLEEGGGDPGFAFRVPLALAPGESLELVLLFGEGQDLEETRRLLEAYGRPGAAQAALEEVQAFWRETLGGVQVKTPEPALDLMVNGWLPYQNLSCRIWGRTAYYQSGGAFGFRDQLQDAASLVYLLPRLTRSQILLHAAHQFPEGDVLHWWHPPLEHGIRTRFSDDLLWLPYLTAFYLESTGDWELLEEVVPYRAARLLEPGEDEAYLASRESSEKGDLYDHCCRALDRALARTGAHGLPLMGTGDWNDGMNRVGRLEKGESVWMAFFLYAILDGFLPICRRRGDPERIARFCRRQEELAEALEKAGWDGEWYRRAYYDDGAPLGSASDQECRIDCLAQAWAVISRAVPEDRARKAMEALERHLVDEKAAMIRLLTPAFDTCEHDPGYIKGYIPGVRENGGQYTHGALWAVKATAGLGDVDRAAHLLALLSPVTHGRTAQGIATYQTEPYVIAADVYGVEPLVGRGGWTWYTGSAGWMYRVALEDVLGFRLAGEDALGLRPRLPGAWDHLGLQYRCPRTGDTFDIQVERGDTPSAALDGEPLEPGPGGELRIPVPGDGRSHRVRVVVERPSGAGRSPSKG